MRIPGWLTMLIALFLGGLSVCGTHQLAHDRHLTRPVLLTMLGVGIILILMAWLSSGLVF